MSWSAECRSAENKSSCVFHHYWMEHKMENWLWQLQQPAGCIRQSSGFSFPSQYNHYTSVETKAKTSEPALTQRQTPFCQNTLVSQYEHWPIHAGGRPSILYVLIWKDKLLTEIRCAVSFSAAQSGSRWMNITISQSYSLTVEFQ